MGDDGGVGVSWLSQIPNKKLQDQSVVTLIGRKYKATKTKQKIIPLLTGAVYFLSGSSDPYAGEESSNLLGYDMKKNRSLIRGRGGLVLKYY